MRLVLLLFARKGVLGILYHVLCVFLVGMGKGSSTEKRQDNQDAYLQLSVTILAAFCRVSSIASSDDMVNKIPLILEILSKELGPPLVEECFEFLYLVSTAHSNGVEIFYKSGGMTVLASHMPNLPDGMYIYIYIGAG
ncbi:putative neurochondrin [Helianthus annuus]|nr:putative neurochondrin [Helianthus annuus]